MNLTVLKLGGSLMGSSELLLWLERIVSAAKSSSILVVPGGGKFADSVRHLQKIYQFNDKTAHHMALLAMCQFAYYLAELNSKFVIIKNDDELVQNLDKKLPLLWLPYELINLSSATLKASWDVSSDSIALWLAIRLTAEKLILVKSKELSSDRKQIINHINNGDIDQSFQELIDNYSGELLIYSRFQYTQL